MLSEWTERNRDVLILVARMLLMALFVTSGWSKLMSFSGTAGYMASLGVPLPEVATAIAILMEFFVAIALILGIYTRPLALLMVLFTLGTALLGHHFWTMEGAARAMNQINFYKNLSIMGGLLLLAVTGAGKIALTRK